MFEATKGRGPGQWWPCVDDDGNQSATLYCQKCTKPMALTARGITTGDVVCPNCGHHDDVTLVGWQQAAVQAPAPAHEQADTVQLVGVKGGVETVIGTATMPPKMKARELVQSYFGPFDGGDDDASDGAMAYWAACELIDWMEKTPPVFNVQALAVAHRIVWKHGDPETGDPGVMGIASDDGSTEWLDDGSKT